MFLGCYLLNTALDAQAADVLKSLALLATINVYEAALIGLGLVLLRRTGPAARDGVLLLFVQMLFLMDGPFLIAQVIQAATPWDWTLAVGLAVLALAKAAIVIIAAGIPVRVRTLGFLGFQILLLYILPVGLSRLSVAGELAPVVMYVVWWIVGMLPAVYDFLARFENLPELPRREIFLRRALLVVPWLLLVAHLGFFHWVYQAEFIAADLAPVFLGLAVATRRLRPTRFVPVGHILTVRYGLPVIAVLLGMLNNGPLAHVQGLAITPGLVTFAMAFVTYGYFFSLWAAGIAAGLVLLGLMARILAPDILAVLRKLMDVLSQVLTALQRLIPTTPAAWGVIAISAAFVLLGLGALASLRSKGGTPLA
jgi:hypothetical protein